MSVSEITTDDYGNRYAAVHVEELDEWAWLIARVEDWLLQADPWTAADWAHFAGPCGPRIEEVITMFGNWSVRMRNLAGGGRR